MEPTPVAVVIPAYNAAETLAETLESVLNQTHTALEIVVVDDGSTDNTRSIAEAFAERDSRVRVIGQPNGGVARARNTGIAATTAEFVAPVDADDLWHPEKIARQLEVMRTGGPELGFVYTSFRFMDEQSFTMGYNSVIGPFRGWIYLRHILFNLVGSGSSLLIRRAVVEEVGGYDPSLHDQGLQGAEDWLIQLLIAQRWKVGLVPEYLVGYRQRFGTMSEDRVRMTRSVIACINTATDSCPHTPLWILELAHARLHTTVFLRCLITGRFSEALTALYDGIRASPMIFSTHTLHKLAIWPFKRLRESLFHRFHRLIVQQHFLSLQPDEGKCSSLDFLLRAPFRRIAALEGPPAGEPVSRLLPAAIRDHARE